MVQYRLIDKKPAIILLYLVDGDKIMTESDVICVYIYCKAKGEDMMGEKHR